MGDRSLSPEHAIDTPLDVDRAPMPVAPLPANGDASSGHSQLPKCFEGMDAYLVKALKTSEAFHGDPKLASKHGTSVKALCEEFLFGWEMYFTARPLGDEQKALVIALSLEGHAKSEYMKKRRGQPPLSYEDTIAFIKNLVNGIEDGPFAKFEALEKFDVSQVAWDASGKNVKALPIVISEFEKLIEKCGDHATPDVYKCYRFIKSMPHEFQSKIRFDMSSGIAYDWDVFAKLKNHALGYASEFLTLCVKSQTIKSTPQVNSPKKHKYSEVVTHNFKKPKPNVESGGSSGSKSLATKFNPSEVRSELRSSEPKNGYRLWIQGMNPEKSRKLRSQGKCLLCAESGHMVASCKHKEKLFNKGKFFYYPADYKSA
jgi:hypothetical protein